MTTEPTAGPASAPAEEPTPAATDGENGTPAVSTSGEEQQSLVAADPDLPLEQHNGAAAAGALEPVDSLPEEAPSGISADAQPNALATDAAAPADDAVVNGGAEGDSSETVAIEPEAAPPDEVGQAAADAAPPDDVGQAAADAAPPDDVGQAAADAAPPDDVGQAAADAAPQADAESPVVDALAGPGADATVGTRVPAGPEPTTMEELLNEQSETIKSFKPGDVVEGSVVRIDKDEILVDIGAKSEGVVSNRELYGRNPDSQPQLSVGDTVLVYVLQPESNEGHVVLSLRRAGLERKWRAMQEQLDSGVIIEAPVIDHNKGGLIVDCGIRGFVPISQIVDFPRRPQNDQPRDAAQEIAEKLQPYVGRKLRLKILEVNRKANRLILSEKVALYEERREKRDELFSSLQVGQRVTGTVRSIAPFGVFIDLGGIDGLVHKSELSWNKVNNPEAGYKVGDEVEAEVIDINHERGRISLSIRRLQPDPWNSTVADFRVNDVIEGTVTKIVNFGAFVRVREGLEGLIHISELSHQRVAHPGEVVHEGQRLRLKIISLDSERHRLGLSLKQAEEPSAAPTPAREPARDASGAGRERGERRGRQDRAYDPSQAVQEPEGGIDNTLAAAFAQARQRLEERDVATEQEEVVAADTTAAAEDGSDATETDDPTAAAEPDLAPTDGYVMDAPEEVPSPEHVIAAATPDADVDFSSAAVVETDDAPALEVPATAAETDDGPALDVSPATAAETEDGPALEVPATAAETEQASQES